METTELRIGNFINGKAQVRGITDYTVYVNPTGRHQTTSYRRTQLKPIPLTEQWLKDFGFVKNNGKFFRDHPYFIGYKDWLPEGFWMLRDPEVPIRLTKYVHQLQNLYFALTGNELIKQ